MCRGDISSLAIISGQIRAKLSPSSKLFPFFSTGLFSEAFCRTVGGSGALLGKGGFCRSFSRFARCTRVRDCEEEEDVDLVRGFSGDFWDLKLARLA